jgi:hypothetical protein
MATTYYRAGSYVPPAPHRTGPNVTDDYERELEAWHFEGDT